MNRGLLNGGLYVNTGEVYRIVSCPIKKPRPETKYIFKDAVRKRLEPLFDQLSYETERNLEDCEVQSQAETSTMPSVTEEAALLGMDDIELRNVQLQTPTGRRFGQGSCEEVRVRTDRGELCVAVQGDRSKPAILTLHDLGVNHASFQPFFNYVDMRALLMQFCVYHVNAPGQEERAPCLPDDFVYPTMDELANQLNYVMGHFGITSFIGFGVGAGANILARFALTNPRKVNALALINCTSSSAGWIEWAYQKLNSRSLRSRGMTPSVLDYLMWHHFGGMLQERNTDLVQVYRTYFTRYVNPSNLSLFIDAYARRTDLNINREAATIKVPVLNITGALSPHVEDTVTFNGRLNPSISTWMKIQDCGMALEEQPAKVSQAFRLFLQGEGYALRLRSVTSAASSSTSTLN